MTITITGVTRLHREPSREGVRHLAHVNISLGEIIHLDGCLLVDTPSGRQMWMPRPESTSRAPRVRLSKPLLTAMADASSAALNALESVQSATPPEISAAVELVRQVEARDAA